MCHERRVETGDTPHELLIDRFLSLEELEVVYLYLDAIALRVRTAGKVVSSPVLVAVSNRLKPSLRHYAGRYTL